MGNDTYLCLRATPTGRGDFDPLSSFELRSDEAQEGAYHFETQALDLDPQAAGEARRDPQVAAIAQPMPLKLIQPVPAAELSAEPATLYDAAWGVFATGALQSPYIGRGVTVAILDTGIDAAHEAFRGIELIQKDFSGEGDGDQNGHGTHVAGTIFGQNIQGLRIGVAPGVRRALIGKVLGGKHSATTQELVAAIQWAVDGGAQIINMSLGFDFPGLVQAWVEEQGLEVELATSRALARYRDNVRFFDKLVDLLHARSAEYSSALIIAAAGNDSRRQKRADYTMEVAPPAAADGVISVAALQSPGPPHNQLGVAPFSNIRAAVAAPGVDIYSARKGGGGTSMSGTSMASPHVAGVAALWAERQLKRNGVVNIAALDAQLRGHTRIDQLANASYPDVGEGLVAAPQD